VGSIIKHIKNNTEVKHPLHFYCGIKTSEVGRFMEYTITESGQVGYFGLEMGFAD
jgi:hypothetical protein